MQPANIDDVVDSERYQRLVAMFIYLSHTRLDIYFKASMISQFIHSPRLEYFVAVYKILKYLKGSPRKGLFIRSITFANRSLHGCRLGWEFRRHEGYVWLLKIHWQEPCYTMK